MNVYDLAHQLARALRRSEEYQKFLEARSRVEADPKNKEMLRDYRKSQWEFQKARLLGRELGEEEKERVRRLAELVNLNPTLQELFSCEMRFARLVADIQKILVDAIPEWAEITKETLAEESGKES